MLPTEEDSRNPDASLDLLSLLLSLCIPDPDQIKVLQRTFSNRQSQNRDTKIPWMLVLHSPRIALSTHPSLLRAVVSVSGAHSEA